MEEIAQRSFFIAGQSAPTVVQAVRGRERLSVPFRYEVDFLCHEVNPDEARGGTASFELVDTLGERCIVHGQVERLEVTVLAAANAAERARFRAHIVPLPYLKLRYRRGYRIFQDMTAVDIVKKVFEDAGVPGDAVEWRTTGSYPTRTYCVQYDETEWDFVSRLLEDEGIYYAFEHDIDGHVMVMLDDNASAPDLAPTVLSFVLDEGVQGVGHRAWTWDQAATVVENHVTLRDYDFERPSLDLECSVEANADGEAYELYEYPGAYANPKDGNRLAQVRLDAFQSERRTARCHTNVLGALPGAQVEIEGHPSVDAKLLITGVDLHVRLDEADLPNPLVDVGVVFAETVLHLQPFAQQFRPRRHAPRPRVFGVQTAVVAGPAGEEIHVDELGRVKVQFHWDREGVGDDHASCWIRTAQSHTTGSIMIPRIGWEVLVEFIDGDPDRPVVLGRLWNPNSPPPHALPANKTFSGHSSVSSPGRGGVNEIIMDDQAGAERLLVNAQHDYTLVAANNAMVSVGKNMIHTVGGDRSETTSGNEKAAVTANQNDSVTGDHTVTVSGSRTIDVSGSASEETTGSMTFTCGGSENVIVGSPAAAVLEVIASQAIEAATGAAAQAASRAQAAILGPIAPALESAREAVGAAASLAGPAGALLGGGNSNLTSVMQAAGSLSDVAGAASAGSIAAGVAHSAMSGALAQAGMDMVRGRGGSAAGGAGGAGAGGAGEDPAAAAAAGATGGGTGTWGPTVGGAVSETVGGAFAIASAAGIAFGIGGSNTETIGAARLETVRGGKSEVTGGAKVEVVGVYKVKASAGYGVDASAAIVLDAAGLDSTKCGGGHSIAAEGPVVISAASMKMKASGKITLACGACKVVISSSGIDVQGASSVQIQGSNIQLDENVMGT